VGFRETVEDAAYERSGGQCKCRRVAHPVHPSGRCPTSITRDSAEFHHIQSEVSGGSDGLSNCEALCPRCQSITPSLEV
jgi:hypothetical protein